MLNQGKTNLKYILIVLILAALVGGGVLFYSWQVKVATTNSPEIVSSQKTIEPLKPIDTSGWKTYQNKTLGLEFRHPPEWYVKEDGERFLLFDSVTSCVQGTCPTKKSQIGFGVENNTELLPISDWIKKNVGAVGIENDTAFSTDNLQGIKRIYQGANNSAAILVIFSQKDKLALLYYFETSGAENGQILDAILASFKASK